MGAIFTSLEKFEEFFWEEGFFIEGVEDFFDDIKKNSFGLGDIILCELGAIKIEYLDAIF